MKNLDIVKIEVHLIFFVITTIALFLANIFNFFLEFLFKLILTYLAMIQD